MEPAACAVIMLTWMFHAYLDGCSKPLPCEPCPSTGPNISLWPLDRPASEQLLVYLLDSDTYALPTLTAPYSRPLQSCPTHPGIWALPKQRPKHKPLQRFSIFSILIQTQSLRHVVASHHGGVQDTMLALTATADPCHHALCTLPYKPCPSIGPSTSPFSGSACSVTSGPQHTNKACFVLC